MSSRLVPLCAALMALLLAACGGARNVQPGVPLSYVPADTPYVFANLEPLPTDVLDAYGKMMTPMREAYSELLARLREEVAAKVDDPEDSRKVLSVMELLEDKFTIEGWERIGFSRQGRAAIYGVGVLPVIRVELADPDKLRGFIAELERRTNETFPVAEIDGHSYWRFAPEQDKPFALVMAILDRHLIITLDPGTEIAVLPDLLGLNPPKQSLAESDELAAINSQYGYGPYGTLLVDSRRLLAAVIGDGDDDTWVTRKMAAEGKTLSPVCRSEFAGMAEQMPRIVAGYNRFDVTGMDSSTVFELKPSLAQGLMPVAAPVPGLGASAGATALDVGFGIKLDKLAEFIQAQANAINAAPYACEHLSSLNQGATQTGQQMAGLHMAAGWFTGMRAVLTALDWSEGEGKPERMEGAFVIASPNPAGLLGMLKGFSPELAKLELTPGAAPQALPLAKVAGAMADSLPPSYAAMTDNAIGIGFGTTAVADLPRHMAEPAATPAPLLYMSYQGQVYGQLMQKMQAFGDATAAATEAQTDKKAAAAAGGDQVQSEQAQARAREFERVMKPFLASMYRMYDAIDYTTVSLIVTERGVEMRQVMRLK